MAGQQAPRLQPGRSAVQPVVAMTRPVPTRRRARSRLCPSPRRRALSRGPKPASADGRCRVTSAPSRPRSRAWAATACPRPAVAEDRDGVHVVGPSLRVVEGRPGVCRDKRTRSPSWCRGPLVPPFPEAPFVSHAPSTVPSARASRQGRHSLFFDSSEKVWRCMWRTYAYSGLHATITPPGLPGFSPRAPSPVPPPPIVPDAGTLGETPASADERERGRGRGRRVIKRHRARRAGRVTAGPCPTRSCRRWCRRPRGRRGRHRRTRHPSPP